MHVTSSKMGMSLNLSKMLLIAVNWTEITSSLLESFNWGETVVLKTRQTSKLCLFGIQIFFEASHSCFKHSRHCQWLKLCQYQPFEVLSWIVLWWKEHLQKSLIKVGLSHRLIYLTFLEVFRDLQFYLSQELCAADVDSIEPNCLVCWTILSIN